MRVVFPGSFDPPTYGHLHIVERCARMFRIVNVVIADNTGKRPTFTKEERFALLRSLLSQYENVQLFSWDALIVDFLKKHGMSVLVRGVRSASDYDYEFMLAQINRGLGKDVETILIPTDQKYFVLRSSVIKNIVLLGGDVSDKVPQMVVDALKEKLNENAITLHEEEL